MSKIVYVRLSSGKFRATVLAVSEDSITVAVQGMAVTVKPAQIVKRRKS